MNLNFYKNLISALLKKDYNILRDCYDSEEISADSKYIGFIKKNGSILNFVYLVKLDSFKASLLPFVKSLKELSLEIAKNNNSKNTAILVIYIGGNEDITEEVSKLCLNADFDISSSNLFIHWLANTSTLELSVSKNQPNKLDGIEKLIKDSFKGLAGGFTDISRAIENENINKIKSYKSKNIFLTLFLIAINIIVYIFMLIYGNSESIETLLAFGAISPDLIINEHEYYRLFTSMFVHIGFVHLLSNIFSLYIIGSRIEKYMGKLPYILIYILSGLSSSLFSTYFTIGVSAGASGALFGLYSAILCYTAFNRRSMSGIDIYAIILIIIVGLSFSLMLPNIDNFGHLGGLIGGLVLSLIYTINQKIKNKKGENINA